MPADLGRHQGRATPSVSQIARATVLLISRCLGTAAHRPFAGFRKMEWRPPLTVELASVSAKMPNQLAALHAVAARSTVRVSQTALSGSWWAALSR